MHKATHETAEGEGSGGHRVRRGAELLKALIGIAFLCAAPLFLAFAPAWAERYYPTCFLRLATGLYCPGCGTLRACRSLGSLDIWEAFLYNPFLFLFIIPLTVYLCVIFLMRAFTGKWVPSLLSSHKAILPVAALIAAIWIFRNVFPLTL
ncbi:MAG: DUF2752 domain-containing protein [Chitinispirillales bacterium]|jgi:hypothetical protein|nr:DUF2752 domain-containing protein [Chitinispirillales bacterium]